MLFVACKIRYVSKITEESRGSPCDSTAFLFGLWTLALRQKSRPTFLGNERRYWWLLCSMLSQRRI